MTRFLLFLLLLPPPFVPSHLRADALPSEAPPLGAKEGAIDGYLDYAAYVKQLAEFKSVASLGKTLGGREVHVITLATGKPEEKPAILIMGAVHAPHLAGAELALRMAKLLAKDEKLLDRVTFYVVPRPSPDAGEAFFKKPFAEHPGNDRKTDDDRDGDPGEDPPDDLNKDGWITMMRVEDPTGPMMAHPDDPRVLIAADPKKNERAAWRVMVEGRDDDGDGQFNEDGGGGVAFNRNFTFNYPVFKVGAGPNQVSEVETRAIAEFVHDHHNIAAIFSFSPDDNLMNPWKADPASEGNRIKTKLLQADAPFTDYLAEQYKKIHGGADCPASAAGEGSFTEWAYFHAGRWSFAARGWWIPKVPVEPAPTETRGADIANALRWFKQETIDGFVDWTPVDHPDFPGKKVEVGGIKPFFLLNPPAKELDGLAEKHRDFVVKLAGFLPTLSIGDVKIEALGEGVFRVTVPVLNTGYLPTMSSMGETNREMYPLQLKIDLPEKASLVNGVARVKLTRIEGGAKTEHVFLVKGAGDAKLTVWAPAVGSDSKPLVLK